MNKFLYVRLKDIRSNLALLNGNSDFKHYEYFLDKTINMIDEIFENKEINPERKNHDQ